VDENTVDVGREYEEPGLAADPRAKGQMPPLSWYVAVMVGDGGLGSRIVSDRRAVMADMGLAPLGLVGGEKCIELGRDGEARGMMSLGSGFPDA